MNQSIRTRLLAGTLVLFAARLLLSLVRTGPVLVADEIGYLTNARVLAGGLPGQLEQAPFYRGGYSLLIAPLVNLSSDPSYVYHLVLILNAALAASVFPLLYLLLTRFAGVRPGRAIWAALAGALYPALTVLSQVAMSENALFPLVCLWLIAFAGLLRQEERRGGLLWAAALGVATGALWAVHARMIVAVVLAIGGLVWLALRRRLQPAALVLGLAVIAAAIVGVHYLDSFLINHNYAGAAPDELSERMDSLFSFHGLRTAAANLLGQSWYLLVATFGLAAAAVADFVVGWRRRGDATRERTAPVLGVLLALTALLLLISASAFPERTRPDMLIYGRYAEIVAPALIAFGLVALSRVWLSLVPDSGTKLNHTLAGVRQMAWPLAGFGALTAVVVLIRATASDPDAPNRWNISALPFITVQLGPAILIGAALIALAGAGLLLWASVHGTRVLGVAALGLFLAVVAYGTWNPVRSSEQAVYPLGWESPRAAVESAGAKTVAYDLDHYDTIGLYTVQWFMPKTKLTLFHDSRQPPPSRFVLSDEAWAHRHPGARALWRAAGRDEVLWKTRRRGAH
jgi:4-amino-4-deoxy-L-arabinose transferase-like glycosyltransferase